MSWTVKKIVHDRWNYWLDDTMNWNGLKNNAARFSRERAEEISNQKQNPLKTNERIFARCGT